MRLFVAFSIPEELCRALVQSTRSLRAELPQARWVPADNLHLTLHFVGEVEPEVAMELTKTLGPVFARHDPIDFEVAAAGAFPGGRPRVVWIGLAAPSRLCRLQQEVAVAAGKRFSSSRRPRPFRPHVTLARCRGDWRSSDLSRVKKCLAPLEGQSFVVEQGYLYESRLSQSGARYSIAGSFPLRNAKRDPLSVPASATHTSP